MKTMARFRLNILLVVGGLLGVTAVQAEIPRLPFEVFAGGGIPVNLVKPSPITPRWTGVYTIQCGIEGEWGGISSFRVEYSYHRFRKTENVNGMPDYPRPAKFNSLIFDQIVSFTQRDAAFRPYVFWGLGALWGGKIWDINARTEIGYATKDYTEAACQIGIGFATKIGPRVTSFLESSYVSGLSDFRDDYTLGFVPVRFGLSVR